MAAQVEEAAAKPTTATPPAAPAAPAPAPPLLRLKLAGPEARAVVAVCRARVLRHQEEQRGENVGNELEAAAREVRWTHTIVCDGIHPNIGHWILDSFHL